MRLPGQMKRASRVQTCRSFTMTYDVWSQTGPQTDGQVLNLSRYVKGAGWFDPSRDYTVTALFSPRAQHPHNSVQAVHAGAVDVSSCGAGGAQSVFSSSRLGIQLQPILCTMIPDVQGRRARCGCRALCLSDRTGGRAPPRSGRTPRFPRSRYRGKSSTRAVGRPGSSRRFGRRHRGPVARTP